MQPVLYRAVRRLCEWNPRECGVRAYVVEMLCYDSSTWARLVGCLVDFSHSLPSFVVVRCSGSGRRCSRPTTRSFLFCFLFPALIGACVMSVHTVIGAIRPLVFGNCGLQRGRRVLRHQRTLYARVFLGSFCFRWTSCFDQYTDPLLVCGLSVGLRGVLLVLMPMLWIDPTEAMLPFWGVGCILLCFLVCNLR